MIVELLKSNAIYIENTMYYNNDMMWEHLAGMDAVAAFQ